MIGKRERRFLVVKVPIGPVVLNGRSVLCCRRDHRVDHLVANKVGIDLHVSRSTVAASYSVNDCAIRLPKHSIICITDPGQFVCGEIILLNSVVQEATADLSIHDPLSIECHRFAVSEPGRNRYFGSGSSSPG